jgi:hypothetical protein
MIHSRDNLDVNKELEHLDKIKNGIMDVEVFQ